MEKPSILSPIAYTRIIYSFLFDIFIFQIPLDPLSVIGNILIVIGSYKIIIYD